LWAWIVQALRKKFEKVIAHEFFTASIRVPSSDNGNHLQVQTTVQKRKDAHGQHRDIVKMKARLYTKYVNDVVPALKAKHNYSNVHQIPRIEKIVVNMGISASLEKGAIEDAAKDLTSITGRKPAISKSRHAIANFKLRENQPIGCRVTLRADAMYEFFDRLVAVTLPRIRDFRGLSPRKFDGRGNYTFGISDQSIFPEIELEKVKRQQGMDVTIVTSAPTDAQALDLLKHMGFPFAEK
jgi:large subunit ribosomal protein L5